MVMVTQGGGKGGDAGFTSTRVPFADALGVLTDDAGLTYTVGTTTLNVTSGIVTGTIGPTAARQHILPNVASSTIGLLTTAQTWTGTNTFSDGNALFIRNQADSTKAINISAAGITTGTTRTYTMPDATDTLIGRITTDTGANRLKNKDIEAGTTNIVDGTDATKKVQFAVSGITTGTTRTVTWPNASFTVPTTGGITAGQFMARQSSAPTALNGAITTYLVMSGVGTSTFSGTGATNGTNVDTEVIMPGAGTITAFSANVTAGTLNNAETWKFTLFKNGAATTMTGTFTASGGNGGVGRLDVSTNPNTYALGDKLTFEIQNNAGLSTRTLTIRDWSCTYTT